MHPASKACSILSPIVETVKSEMVGQELRSWCTIDPTHAHAPADTTLRAPAPLTETDDDPLNGARRTYAARRETTRVPVDYHKAKGIAGKKKEVIENWTLERQTLGKKLPKAPVHPIPTRNRHTLTPPPP
ncbi:unnamed protein product [Boreogadus saida]